MVRCWCRWCYRQNEAQGSSAGGIIYALTHTPALRSLPTTTQLHKVCMTRGDNICARLSCHDLL